MQQQHQHQHQQQQQQRCQQQQHSAAAAAADEQRSKEALLRDRRQQQALLTPLSGDPKCPLLRDTQQQELIRQHTFDDTVRSKPWTAGSLSLFSRSSSDTNNPHPTPQGIWQQVKDKRSLLATHDAAAAAHEAVLASLSVCLSVFLSVPLAISRLYAVSSPSISYYVSLISSLSLLLCLGQSPAAAATGAAADQSAGKNPQSNRVSLVASLCCLLECFAVSLQRPLRKSEEERLSAGLASMADLSPEEDANIAAQIKAHVLQQQQQQQQQQRQVADSGGVLRSAAPALIHPLHADARHTAAAAAAPAAAAGRDSSKEILREVHSGHLFGRDTSDETPAAPRVPSQQEEQQEEQQQQQQQEEQGETDEEKCERIAASIRSEAEAELGKRRVE